MRSVLHDSSTMHTAHCTLVVLYWVVLYFGPKTLGDIADGVRCRLINIGTLDFTRSRTPYVQCVVQTRVPTTTQRTYIQTHTYTRTVYVQWIYVHCTSYICVGTRTSTNTIIIPYYRGIRWFGGPNLNRNNAHP